MTKSPIIILEIPHQKSAKAWIAYGWDDAAARCATRDGQTPAVQLYSLANLISCYGTEEDVPPDAIAIAREFGAVAEVQTGHDEFEYMPPAKVPPLSAVVQEWISSDLNNAFFLESAEEAREFLATYSGHQAGKARAAALREAIRLEWIEEEPEDEDEDEDEDE